MGNYYSTPPLSYPIVSNFDPERYSGLWYEQGRSISIPWQRDCQYATATYNWTGQKLELVNICHNNKGSRDIKGVACLQPSVNQKAILKVAFEGIPGCGDYYVHYTDYDHFAIVGSPCQGYVWILSRNKIISKEIKLKLQQKVLSWGYGELHFNFYPEVLNMPTVAVENEVYRKTIYKDSYVEHVLVSMKPGQKVDWETHLGSQTIFLYQGEATFKLAGQTLLLKKAGDSIIIPPKVCHYFENSGKSDLKLLSIYTPYP